MKLHLAKAYIGALFDNCAEGRITFEDARVIEDEVLPACEACGKLPIKALVNGQFVCGPCALHMDQHTTE